MSYTDAMKPTPWMFAPVLALALSAVACGGSAVPAATPTTTSAVAAPAEPVAAVEATPARNETETASAPAAVVPAAEAAPEKCDASWVCVKVTFATRKVEKRETMLMGDPKIESTWSKQSDGRTATFDEFSKGPVELTLRRKPNNKNEVVVKVKGGGEIVIDRHDGTIEDFTHIGAIATEQDGALLIDMRYMR
jgi:SH3-like domain-containing protein